MLTPGGQPARFFSATEAALHGLYDGDEAAVERALQRRLASVEAVRALVEDDDDAPLLALIGETWTGWYEIAIEVAFAERWRAANWDRDRGNNIPPGQRDPAKVTAALRQEAWHRFDGSDAMTGQQLFHRDDVYDALYRHRAALPPRVEREVEFAGGAISRLYGFEPTTAGIVNQKFDGHDSTNMNDLNFGPLMYCIVAYDHVVPHARGGFATSENVVPVSKTENTIKLNFDLDAIGVAAPISRHD